MSKFHTSHLLSSNYDLFISGKYSDLTIRCEDDPEIVERLLHYLYKLDYVDEEALDKHISGSRGDVQPSAKAGSRSNEPSDSQQISKSKNIHNALLTNTRVYAAADKYDIPDLKHLAHEKLRSRLCLKPFPWHDFHINVLEVVQSTPTSDTDLRDTVLKVCVEAVEEITGVTRKSGISAEDWAPVLKEDPDFLLAILQSTVRANVCALEDKDKIHGQEVAALEKCHAKDKNLMEAQMNYLKDVQTPKRPNVRLPSSASTIPYPFSSRTASSRPRDS
ncbi:MAG: hypothetical protein Q9195_005858 [Heterodermia aff. obscurata]